jgi:hypothetical protein
MSNILRSAQAYRLTEFGVPQADEDSLREKLQSIVVPDDMPPFFADLLPHIFNGILDNYGVPTLKRDAVIQVISECVVADSDGARDSATRTACATPLLTEESDALIEFPRIWSILAFALPRKLRDEVFVPAEWELKADFLLKSLEARTPLERRVVRTIFTILMAGIYLQSLWACAGDKVRRFLHWIGLMTVIELFRNLF